MPSGELPEFRRHMLSELDRVSRVTIAQADKIDAIREQQAGIIQDNEHCEESRRDHEMRLRKAETTITAWSGSKTALLFVLTTLISLASVGIALLALWKK